MDLEYIRIWQNEVMNSDLVDQNPDLSFDTVKVDLTKDPCIKENDYVSRDVMSQKTGIKLSTLKTHA